MATTFVATRVGRQLAEDMFADLGIAAITITPLVPYGVQIEAPGTLTAANIMRAKIRIGTRDTTQETLLVNGMSAIDNLDAYLAIPAPSQAQAIAMVKTLVQDVRGLIMWVGKDVIG